VNQWICGHIWICEGGSVTEDEEMHLRGCAVRSIGRRRECRAVCEWVDGHERQRERRDYEPARALGALKFVEI
jgi:hypothetical protein